MSYYRYRIDEARNNLWRDKENYRIKENNLRRLNELENKKNLLENELLKIKAENERNLIQEKNYQEEKELKQKNSIINNINTFDQFLLDNKFKSELEKKRIENNNEINLKQMENDFNLNRSLVCRNNSLPNFDFMLSQNNNVINEDNYKIIKSNGKFLPTNILCKDKKIK